MNFIYEDSLEGVTRSITDAAPSHYIFKIQSFSVLSKNSITRYESNIFETEGYKWKLSLHPSGNKDINEKDHISLYLAVAETNSLPTTWEVNVFFRFFLYDQIRDKYVKVEDNGRRVRRFHAMKTEWGFPQFISLTTFNDPSNGYLLNDTCVFGAEVFVCKNKGQGECLSLITDSSTVNHSWKIERFSQLKDDFYYSSSFMAGDYKWQIKLYPRGSGMTKDASISVYLALDRSTPFPKGQKVYVNYKLRVRDQTQSEHTEKKTNFWFTEQGAGYGFPNFVSLDALNDNTKGFLLKDTCIIEAEVLVLGTVSKFP